MDRRLTARGRERRHQLMEVATERFAAALRRGQEVAVADVARHVKEGIVEGRIRDDDPVVLTHAILGVTSQLARIFVHGQGRAGAEVADSAVAFCLEGLLGRPRPDLDPSLPAVAPTPPAS